MSSKNNLCLLSQQKDCTRHNNPRAHAVHKKVAEMITCDCHPFFIVNDNGFRSLLNMSDPQYNIPPSRKFFTITPKLFKDTKSVVGKEMSAVSH